MAVIKPHSNPAPVFSVANKFPDMPKLERISDEDNAALQKWHQDMLNVVTRQFDQLTAAIDKKVDKT